MASKRRDLSLELAIAAERIRGLEAQVATLTKALEQSLSQPAVVYQSDAGPTGPGFSLLAQRLMANADTDDASPAPVVDLTPKVTWFRADGGDPAEKVAS
jgi:hypothetical protein